MPGTKEGVELKTGKQKITRKRQQEYACLMCVEMDREINRDRSIGYVYENADEGLFSFSLVGHTREQCSFDILYNLFS